MAPSLPLTDGDTKYRSLRDACTLDILKDNEIDKELGLGQYKNIQE
ncbi:hypothetical protein L195_g024787, partial [Trifolium pratense]